MGKLVVEETSIQISTGIIQVTQVIKTGYQRKLIKWHQTWGRSQEQWQGATHKIKLGEQAEMLNTQVSKTEEKQLGQIEAHRQIKIRGFRGESHCGEYGHNDKAPRGGNRRLQWLEQEGLKNDLKKIWKCDQSLNKTVLAKARVQTWVLEHCTKQRGKIIAIRFLYFRQKLHKNKQSTDDVGDPRLWKKMGVDEKK